MHSQTEALGLLKFARRLIEAKWKEGPRRSRDGHGPVAMFDRQVATNTDERTCDLSVRVIELRYATDVFAQ
jgi:hypothetical protein